MHRSLRMTAFLLASAWWIGGGLPARADEDASAPIHAAAEAFTKAFNAGKSEAVVDLFLPEGELVDEEGQVYQGHEELKELFSAYFTKYPGAEIQIDVESVRLLGPVSIEEGTRVVHAKDGGGKAQLRYTTVRSKTADGWRIASVREIADDPAPSHQEALQALAWMEGEWVNEGDDAVVRLVYRWSEDKNFLLGEFLASDHDGKPTMKTTQRIGWDPRASKVRSWIFDSDGGFAESSWTQVEDAWTIKSSAVNPDGESGTATITLTPAGKNRFTFKGTDRIVGESKEDDFELTVVRVPPSAGGKSAADIPEPPKAPPAKESAEAGAKPATKPAPDVAAPAVPAPKPNP